MRHGECCRDAQRSILVSEIAESIPTHLFGVRVILALSISAHLRDVSCSSSRACVASGL
jgi:hypothetical protein